MNLRLVLLALLSLKPNTGYGLGRLLRDELHDFWTPRLQQIYSELAAMRKLGHARVEHVWLEKRPDKKVYHVTSSGKAALDDWWASEPLRICRDDLLVRLYCMSSDQSDVVVRRVEDRLKESQARVGALKLQGNGKTGDATGGQHDRPVFLEVALAKAQAEAALWTKVLAIIQTSMSPEETSTQVVAKPSES